MIKQIKSAVLALAIGTIAVSASAQSQTAYPFGELIVGFTSLTNDDVVYDLGQESTLVNGETWDLRSVLEGVDLRTVNWGVIGIGKVSPDEAWVTYDTNQNPNILDSTPPVLADVADLGAIYRGVADIYGSMPEAGAGNSFTISADSMISWAYQTIDAPAGLNTFRDNYPSNPNVNEVGFTGINFYQVDANGSAPIATGSFYLTPWGVLIYSTSPARECK